MLDKHSVEILIFIHSNGKTSIEQINDKFTTNYNNQWSKENSLEIIAIIISLIALLKP